MAEKGEVAGDGPEGDGGVKDRYEPTVDQNVDRCPCRQGVGQLPPKAGLLILQGENEAPLSVGFQEAPLFGKPSPDPLHA